MLVKAERFHVHRKHQALFLGPAGCPLIESTLQSLRKYLGFEGIKYMFNAALREQYPYIHFSDDSVGLFDGSELCLAADEILKYILVSISILNS